MFALRTRTPLLLAVLAFACSSDPTVEPTPASVDTPDSGGTPSPSPKDGGVTPGPDGSTPSPDASGSDAQVSSNDYGMPGPATVMVKAATVTGAGSFSVDLYIPSGAGPFPVVVFSSGLLQSGAAYAPYAKRLASWGIIAITRDDGGLLTNATSLASDVTYEVTTWLPSQNTAAQSPLFGRVDTTRIGLSGHSRGAQVSLIAAQGGAAGKVRAVFGVDPVDNRAASARNKIATMGIPVGFIGETTNSGSSDCAPADSNFATLHGLASSPSVAVTAINADHTMFQDPALCSFCTLCTKGTADQAEVLAYSVRYHTAFFARELKGDTAVGAAFQGAGAAADVTAGKVTLVSK